jgi:hypothetical protein
MINSLILAGSITGYVAAFLFGYRKHYIETFKRYRRWQAEHPNKTEFWYVDYGPNDAPRKSIKYETYMGYFGTSQDYPGWLLAAWPLVVLVSSTYKFTHPEVKVADPAILSKLDAELKKELGEG